jgi:hypothetical protein
MREEERLMARIEKYKGVERIRALEKAIERYKEDSKALPFIDKAIEYYNEDPKAIPLIDKAIKIRKSDMQAFLVGGPILILAGWFVFFILVDFLLPPSSWKTTKQAGGYLVWKGIGGIALLLGIALIAIGIPHSGFKILKLKSLKRRLVKINAEK